MTGRYVEPSDTQHIPLPPEFNSSKRYIDSYIEKHDIFQVKLLRGEFVLKHLSGNNVGV